MERFVHTIFVTRGNLSHVRTKASQFQEVKDALRFEASM